MIMDMQGVIQLFHDAEEATLTGVNARSEILPALLNGKVLEQNVCSLAGLHYSMQIHDWLFINEAGNLDLNSTVKHKA